MYGARVLFGEEGLVIISADNKAFKANYTDVIREELFGSHFDELCFAIARAFEYKKLSYLMITGNEELKIISKENYQGLIEEDKISYNLIISLKLMGPANT